jgi:hypothetical protein
MHARWSHLLQQVSALYTASKLLQSRNEAIRGALLPLTVRLLSTDKVPNVRMAAVQALIAAKSHLVAQGPCLTLLYPRKN